MQMGGVPKNIQLVKFISGLILSKSIKLEDSLPAIEKVFGQIDFKSEPIDFCSYSTYYNPEMGDGLVRYIISFKELGDRTRLPDIKHKSISLEQDFKNNGKRSMNMDPGYMTLGQLFLASTKDNFCRIYIRDNIYEEVTLYYKAGCYQAFPWTYRDYASKPYHDILLKIRSIYKTQLRQVQGDSSGGE